ncbi:hypothetical protein Tco_0123503 [Tanacetum coccineum]
MFPSMPLLEVSNVKVIENKVMAAPVIFISSDVSVESVGSSFPQAILIGSISVEVPVAPEVGAAITPYDSESDTEIPKRHVSPTTSTPEIPTAPILPAPSVVVAPSSEFPLAPVDAPPEIRQRRAILIRPMEDIPIGRLYPTHPGGPCKALTVRKSVRHLPSHRLALRYTPHHLDRFTSRSSLGHSSSDHSSSGHSISGHSLPGHLHQTPPLLIHPTH